MKTMIQLALGILAMAATSALHSQVARYNFDSIYEIGEEFWVPNTGNGGDIVGDINSLDIKMLSINAKRANLVTLPGTGVGAGRVGLDDRPALADCE